MVRAETEARVLEMKGKATEGEAADALIKDKEEGIPFTKFPQSYEETIAWEHGGSA